MAVAPSVKQSVFLQPPPQRVTGITTRRWAPLQSWRNAFTATGLTQIGNADPWSVLHVGLGASVASAIVPPGSSVVFNYTGSVYLISDMSGVPGLIATGDDSYPGGWYTAFDGPYGVSTPTVVVPTNALALIPNEASTDWPSGGKWGSGIINSYPDVQQIWTYGYPSLFGKTTAQCNVYDCEPYQNPPAGLASVSGVTITNGSNQITVASGGFPGAAAPPVGWPSPSSTADPTFVSGPGIPAGTYVTAISGNTLTMSNAAVSPTGAGGPPWTVYFFTMGQHPAGIIPWMSLFRAAPFYDDPIVYVSIVNDVLVAGPATMSADGSNVLTLTGGSLAGFVAGKSIEGASTPWGGWGVWILKVNANSLVVDQPVTAGTGLSISCYNFGLQTLQNMIYYAGAAPPLWWISVPNESYENPANWPAAWYRTDPGGTAAIPVAAQWRPGGLRQPQNQTFGPLAGATSATFVPSTRTTKGNLLRLIVGVDTNTTINLPVGWTQEFQTIAGTATNFTTIAVFRKIADGTEGNTGIAVSWLNAAASQAIFQEFGAGWLGTPTAETIPIVSSGALAATATITASAYSGGATEEVACSDIAWASTITSPSAKWGNATAMTVTQVGNIASAVLFPAAGHTPQEAVWSWTTSRAWAGDCSSYRDPSNLAMAINYQTDSIACSEVLITT